MRRALIALALIASPASAEDLGPTTVGALRFGCEVAVAPMQGIAVEQTPREVFDVTYCGAFFQGIATGWCIPFDAKEALEGFNRWAATGKLDGEAFNVAVYDFLVHEYPCPTPRAS